MRVLDASVVVDAFSGRGERGRRAYRALLGGELIVPSHFDLESISGWRRQVRQNQMTLAEARQALTDLAALPVRRVPHSPLMQRIWELRETVTPADAAYVALAEEFGVPLITTDARLARAPGPRCEFQVIE